MNKLATNLSSNLTDAFNPSSFRAWGHQLIDLLADYLNDATKGNISKVLPYIEPEEQLKFWSLNQPNQNPIEIFKRVIENSTHLHHPHYVGHQNPGVLPISALSDLVDSFLNNPSALYEMGPVSTVMEKHVIDWMKEKIGFSNSAGGFLASGGTLGNLTAILTAKQFLIKEESQKNLAIITSEHAHYSISRTAHVMGLGKDSVISIPLDKNFRFYQNDLEDAYKHAKTKGLTVLAVVGNACSTPTGTYDPLSVMGEFCTKNKIWFHVDGVHGASALLSKKHKNLLAGIELADSVVWDAHKMLLMPGLVTGLIFKNGEVAYETFNPKASYLFQGKSNKEWFNLGRRTFECTKKMIALKIYITLSVHGEQLFSDFIDNAYSLTKKFAQLIKDSKDFELAIEPESNIICFRYLSDNHNELNALQTKIRETIIKDGSFYLTQTQLSKGIFLRCTLMNPFTTIDHLKVLLDTIRETATVN